MCIRDSHRAAHTVRADRGDGAHRHAGQRFRKARIRQFHHGQRAARCAKAVGRSGQLRCILRQGFGCGKGIRSQCQQALVHRGIIDADALRQRAAPGMVQAGMDPLCVDVYKRQLRVRLEFLRYPQFIRRLFNGGRFGPPWNFTSTST